MLVLSDKRGQIVACVFFFLPPHLNVIVIVGVAVTILQT